MSIWASSIDNTGEEYVAPGSRRLSAFAHKKRPSTRWRARHRSRPCQSSARGLDAIAARARALGIPCQVSY
ncbi:MAG: hypothetical protein ACLTYW_09690 [Collinsella sp.]